MTGQLARVATAESLVCDPSIINVKTLHHYHTAHKNDLGLLEANPLPARHLLLFHFADLQLVRMPLEIHQLRRDGHSRYYGPEYRKKDEV